MYSRRLTVEEKKNRRRAFVFVVLTVILIVLIFTYGLAGAAKFSAFLLEIRRGTEAVEPSDTTPPPPPRFDSLPTPTNQESIELKGSTEAGASVSVKTDGKKQEVLAGRDGRFLLTLNLSEGENSIEAIAKDNAGNISQITQSKIVLDKEAPSLEITKPQEGTEFFGSRQRQIIIEGKTEEDAKVQINDRLVIVESDGTFSFVTTLSEGENTFAVKSEDEAGNKVEKTFKVKFTP